MFQYQIFGESHGEAIGVVLEGLPSGVPLDMEFVSREMDRRRAVPGDFPPPGWRRTHRRSSAAFIKES